MSKPAAPTNAVTVAVRCRPFNDREKAQGATTVVSMDVRNNVTRIAGQGAGKREHAFAFDHAFWSFDPEGADFCSQEYVYERLGTTVLDAAFLGYNSCLFAYGQTGSGKTYTMMGYNGDIGIIPRICSNLFERCDELTAKNPDLSHRIQVSYMEIYNEKCRCLLNPSSKEVKPREHPSTGPYVEGLALVIVHNLQDIENLMEEGNRVRTVACTAMNATSSRSHAIFTIRFTSILNGSEKASKVNLVDLAGSERADKTGATGSTLKEGANINKSLVCLGKVISALADVAEKKANASHIPYRDSVLTWVLKENLGGNSRTVMLATLSPHVSNYEESLSTLRYADRAKRIKTHAVVNEDPTSRKIRELTEEVARLKEMLENKPPTPAAPPAVEEEPEEAAATPESTPAAPPQKQPKVVKKVVKKPKMAIKTATPADTTTTTTTAAPTADTEAEAEEEVEEVEEEEEEEEEAPEAYQALSAEEQLQITMQALTEVSKPWESLEAENTELQAIRKHDLRKMGLLTVAVDKSLPSLVNLSEDPTLSGCLAYYLKGATTIGAREGSDDEQEEDTHRITIPGILEEHCVITTDAGEDEDGAILTTLRLLDPKAVVYINGTLVQPSDGTSETIELNNRDRVIFGSDMQHVFRFVDPRTSASPRGRREVVDYDMAVREKYSQEVLAFKEKVLTAMGDGDSQQQENSRLLQEALEEKDDLARRAREAEETVRLLQKNMEKLSATVEATVPANLRQPLETTLPTTAPGATPRPAGNAMPLPTPRLSADANATGLAGKARQIDPNLFSAHRQASLQLPAKIVKKMNICVMGPPGTGKSSILKCFQSDPMLGIFKKLPTVTATTRIEDHEHVAHLSPHGNVSSTTFLAYNEAPSPDLHPDPNDMALTFLDFPGEDAYLDALEGFIPARSLFCLTWKISSTDGEMCPTDEERFLQSIETVMARCPAAHFVIIATHLDILPKNSLAGLIEPILMKIESRVVEFIRCIDPDAAENETRRVLGCYAVSCKTRVAFGSPMFPHVAAGVPVKFPDVMKSIAKICHTECVNDMTYPNGAIPGRQLRFAKALLKSKGEGGRLFVPIQEYSQLADECGIADSSELQEVTDCLQAWGIVFLFTQSSRLLDNQFVFMYPAWLRRMTGAVASYAHLVRLGASARKTLAQSFEYGVSAALFADGGSVLENGTLPKTLLAVILHRAVKAMRAIQVPSAQSRNDKVVQAFPTSSEIEMCTQLLGSLDYTFKGRVGGNPLSDTDPESLRCVAPSLFPVSSPEDMRIAVPYLFQKGAFRMVMLNILPKGLFGRLWCRLSRLFRSIEAGGVAEYDAANYLLGDDKRYLPRESASYKPLTNHWKDAMWLALGHVRVLLSVEDTVMYIHAAPATTAADDVFSEGSVSAELPSDMQGAQTMKEVLAHVLSTISLLCQEYPGVTLSICQPCAEVCLRKRGSKRNEKSAANFKVGFLKVGVFLGSGRGSREGVLLLLPGS